MEFSAVVAGLLALVPIQGHVCADWPLANFTFSQRGSDSNGARVSCTLARKVTQRLSLGSAGE
eukprot:CAMPEP_0180514780 /NCGR_PEP_ID=MMETSP1036_2-20121128/52930_1 /TAXON_ID=632150 /ORGANISM="Azadinium spinosum, Strain 3D9" /LENGTH=62 /DNA_ID=CAMNT_0022526261 /DNA_START=278 /DNA_END=466 /DNA_ORIENTATION=-